MTLSPGERLGTYEVQELIGQGGMGEVYRARDAKLNREVALKTLPALVAADANRLARFRREAQVLASLNHSNIAGIYGMEESAGAQALVLELVEGPTLADRIAQASIPLDEALAIATQIAEALEAAHERGIIHRDLKPANIKVRRDGTVKVLDFGLAKALAGEGARSEVSATPTITSPALTGLGVILGTAAYMSPEQARGREADRRSDIWAFGCVLYEMLTGKRAFDGSDVSDAIASILKSDPDWSALPVETPPAIRRVLRRCLEKDARKRIRDIADVRFDIAEAGEQPGPAGGPAAPAARKRERAAWALAGLSLVAVAALGIHGARRPAPSAEVTRFQIYAPDGYSLGSGAVGFAGSIGRGSAVVSPDGTRVVFATTDRAGKMALWMRALDSFDALPVVGSDGATLPFWAPDGRSLGFFVENQLKRLDATGGSPHTLCEVVGNLPRGGAWGADDTIVFASGNSPRLYRVSANGGAPVPLARDTGQSAAVEALWPSFLPDGRTLIYWARTASEGYGVYATSTVAGTPPKKLVTSESNAAYDPSGFLLFTRGGALLRQPFDPARLEVSGEPARVVERVARVQGLGTAAFSVSNTGVLTFQPEVARRTQFAWFDRSGTPLHTVGEPGAYLYPTFSPDGKRLVYQNVSDGNLWILDIERQIATIFTTSPGPKFSPIWSPDGSRIFYRRLADNGFPAIFEKNASGAGEEKLFYSVGHNGPSHISPDGKWLMFFANPPGEFVQDIFVIPTTGEKTPTPVVQSPFADVEPQFSPDGRFVAYASNATGRYETYVQPFPPTGARWPVSNKGGRQPLWRKDGKELFFVSDDSKLYSVEVKPGDTFDYGPPRFLFDMRTNVQNVRNSYIPSDDGQRFLVNVVLDTAAAPIHVIRNWTASLKD